MTSHDQITDTITKGKRIGRINDNVDDETLHNDNNTNEIIMMTMMITC